MAIRIGIVGLPNVGKSTLFQALTRIQVDTSNYPFATIEPNIGIRPVRDARLQKIAEIYGSAKIVPDVLEFIDIAGLIRGAHQGEGLGNEFLSHIFGVDLILEVVRAFKDENVPHVLEGIDPERDIEIIAEELGKKDEEIESRGQDKKIKEKITPPKLSEKPMIYVFNSKTSLDVSRPKAIAVDIKLEDELADEPVEDQKQFRTVSSLDELMAMILKTLGLITFFTANKNEARSHLTPQGINAWEAAGKVHSDFQKKFIRAEVISYDDLVKAGNPGEARKLGLVRTEGHDYKVHGGDIIEFKI